jgi:hypothetical protein
MKNRRLNRRGFLQEAYGDVDIHVQVDEDMVFDDFNEEEADGND